MKKKTILLSAILSMVTLITIFVASDANAKYVVREVSGPVTVKRDGNKVPVTKGMEVSAVDMLELGNNAILKIYSDGESKIFTGKEKGFYSVSTFIFHAEASASDNIATVNGHTNTNPGAKSKRSIHKERGGVTRDIAVFGGDSIVMVIDSVDVDTVVMDDIE